MLRRLHPEQPDSFAFTAANRQWAEAQVTKFPEGRQASAVIPLLWRAQEQEGWLSKPAIESVADMLGMAYIRVLEVATFYFMFQLQPVGSVAHFQICGTTSCMICGAEDLMAVCKDKISKHAHEISEDGKFSWEEVECLGACTNAPMVQIGKDFYEDLTAARFAEIIDELAAGKVPTPGPQNGRFAAEPLGGVTSLSEYEDGKPNHNASVARAAELGDTVKRIQGDEVPILTPWLKGRDPKEPENGAPRSEKSREIAEAEEQQKIAKPEATGKTTDVPGPKSDKTPKDTKPARTASDDRGEFTAKAPEAEKEPETLSAPRGGTADDLKRIKGVGPKLEGVLNELGFWHFEQIANWTSAEVEWVDARLKFKGRIERDDWISQARALADET